jgi:mRNA interferase HigB
MRVIARKTLRTFWEREPGSEAQLKAWFAEAHDANWKGPADVKAKYRNASIVKNDRVVFNICGNKYRLVVRINYRFKVVYIRFIGTHADYDAIDVETI